MQNIIKLFIFFSVLICTSIASAFYPYVHPIPIDIGADTSDQDIQASAGSRIEIRVAEYSNERITVQIEYPEQPFVKKISETTQLFPKNLFNAHNIKDYQVKYIKIEDLPPTGKVLIMKVRYYNDYDSNPNILPFHITSVYLNHKPD